LFEDHAVSLRYEAPQRRFSGTAGRLSGRIHFCITHIFEVFDAARVRCRAQRRRARSGIEVRYG
jgi:hypothetical protein